MKEQPYSCGLGPAFEVIGGKWKALILWEVSEKPRRFGELKRLVPGISEKMLIQQLRELEQDGLITRHAFPEVPPRVEYALSDWGVRLNAALSALADWGEVYAKAMGRYPR
jgi:DNA-binding HxlR family transcriptional regulator